MAQEEQALLALINDTYIAARSAEWAILYHVSDFPGYSSREHETKEESEGRLGALATKLFLQLRILSERLGLSHLRQEILDFERSQENLAYYEINHSEDDIYVPSLTHARTFIEALEALVRPDQVSQLHVFRTLLKHSGKIVQDAKQIPKNESDVRNAVLRVVSYSFTDAIKEPQLPKPLKTYRGDIGVPSISAVAEFKLAKTEEGLKGCVDGVFADMKGYDKVSEWRHFFAVFYMAELFATQEQMESTFSASNANRNWTPIVVTGPVTG